MNTFAQAFTRRVLRGAFPAFLVTLSVVSLAVPSFSQVNTGRVSGSVTDQSGGRVGGAKVTVTDTGTGVVRPLVADASGEYAAPNLDPGVYTVRVEFMGFETFERQNVEVGVGGDVRVDVTLQPGSQAQTITVTEALPVINTTNAQTGGTLSNQLLTSLPLGGRNYRWQQELVPGVLIKPGHGTAALDANGTSDGHGGNNILDGVYLQTFYAGEITFGGGGEAGDTTILPLDAIQEVNLVVNPKAEYGWIPGVTASVGLKSGTNSMHGGVYAFGRDSVFDARNAFASSKNPLAFEQWGGTLGGPIKKDKLFYFIGYESYRENLTSVVTETAPVLSSGAGTGLSIPDAIADLINQHNKGTGGTTTLNNLSLNLAGCNPSKIPALSGTANTGAAIVASGACNANQFGAQGLWNNPNLGVLPNIGRSDNGLFKIDYHINDHHTLNGSFARGAYEEQAAGNSAAKIAQTYWEEILGHNGQMSRIVEIWTPNSTFLNEARWGLDQNSRPVGRAECTPQADPFSNPLGFGASTGNYGGPNYLTQYGLLAGTAACGLPTIILSSPVNAQLGFSNSRANKETNNSGNDIASWTHGTHQFKFGVEVRAGHWTGSKAQDGLNGVINFGQSNTAAFSGATSLESFLAGVPSSETIRAGNPVRDIYQKFVALFAQDDWRIKPRLTLNLGLREEIITGPTSPEPNIGNFNPIPSASTVTGVTAETNAWSTLYELEPRFGFAWDVTGKGTTTLRASTGLEYGVPTLQSNIGGGGTFDLSAVPTGETIFLPNGSTVVALGSGKSAVETLNPITSGGVVTSSPISWPLNSQNSATTALFAPVPQCGNGLAPVNPVPGAPAFNPQQCATNGNASNMAFYRFLFWNVNFQHAFTNNFSVDIGYVGSKSTGIIQVLDLNQPAPDGNINNATAASETARAPYAQIYPWFSNIRFNANSGVDNFRSLQVIMNERASHGLTFNLAYTYAGNYLTQTPLNINLPLNRTFGDNLYPQHRVSITASYQIPGIKSPGQLLQGWAVNTAVSFESPLPVTVLDTKDDLTGAGASSPWSLYGSADPFDKLFGRAGTIPCYGVSGITKSSLRSSPCIQVLPGAATTPWTNMPAACINAASQEPSFPGSDPNNNATKFGLPLWQLANTGCYAANGSAMVAPAQGTYGNMLPFSIHGPGEGIVNLSVTKDWKMRERYSAQFRFEVFNLFNRTQYSGAGVNLGSPNTFGLATSTPDVNTGAGIFGNGGPRDIQFGLKLLF